MKTLPVTAFWLLAGISSLSAGTNPAADQLLRAANEQRDIFHGEGGSFQLDIDFTAQLNVPATGHLRIYWAGRDRWWSKVSLGGFESIEIQNGEWTYTLRNLGFTPLRVREFTSLIRLNEGYPYIATKWKKRIEDGVHLACVQAQLEKNRRDVREFCMDPASHDVLSERYDWLPDEKRREFYSDYFEFRGRRYPRKLQLEVNGSRVIKANVTGLAEVPFNDALLTPPKGAIQRRHCPGMKPAEPIRKPDMPFVGIEGDSTVALTILDDGTVGDVQVIARGGRKLDAANLTNLKQWKFKPAMCGAEPVVSDITITTSVRER